MPLESADKTLGASLADCLGVELIRLGYRVVERAKFARLIEEQDLSVTVLVDDPHSAELGRMVGVDALLFGSVHVIDVIDIGATYKVIYTVTLRMVDVETGEAFLILNYTRNTDLATRSLPVIAKRICSDLDNKLSSGV